MQWFKHDSNAHRDVKLKRLIMRYGLKGYGLYFYCLERITDKLSINNLTFELEDDAEILAHDLGVHVDDVNEMMRFMVEIDLFEDSQGVITCLKLGKRISEYQTSNPKMRQIIKAMHGGHDGVMMESCQSHDGVMQEKKRIEQIRKEKTLSENSKGVSTKCPHDEIQKLWNEICVPAGLPQYMKRTPARDKQIRSRWANGLPDLEQWEKFFRYVLKSKFLTGQSDRPFRPTIDWVTKQSNYVKILEGNYHG